LIHDRTGLFYADDRVDLLAERVAPLVLEHGFDSVLDYYYLLKYEAARDSWPALMDVLAVPETYFWREVDQLKALAREVVPRLAELVRGRAVRIWSIPCAGGEEPLTLAMLLDEAGWFDRMPIEIHASDASPGAIARARNGLYRERAFRSLPPALKERYFSRCGEAWRVCEDLQRRITSWSVVNLMSPRDTAPFESSAIILCRNVFIYFSPAAIAQVVDRFAVAMPSPGYLCVAASESLLKVTQRFHLEEIGGAFMYVKHD
jgi:chemotaxis protein methyltransferase CheR